jgi:hypothetical protein
MIAAAGMSGIPAGTADQNSPTTNRLVFSQNCHLPWINQTGKTQLVTAQYPQRNGRAAHLLRLRLNATRPALNVTADQTSHAIKPRSTTMAGTGSLLWKATKIKLRSKRGQNTAPAQASSLAVPRSRATQTCAWIGVPQTTTPD